MPRTTVRFRFQPMSLNPILLVAGIVYGRFEIREWVVVGWRKTYTPPFLTREEARRVLDDARVAAEKIDDLMCEIEVRGVAADRQELFAWLAKAARTKGQFGEYELRLVEDTMWPLPFALVTGLSGEFRSGNLNTVEDVYKLLTRMLQRGEITAHQALKILARALELKLALDEANLERQRVALGQQFNTALVIFGEGLLRSFQGFAEVHAIVVDGPLAAMRVREGVVDLDAMSDGRRLHVNMRELLQMMPNPGTLAVRLGNVVRERIAAAEQAKQRVKSPKATAAPVGQTTEAMGQGGACPEHPAPPPAPVEETPETCDGMAASKPTASGGADDSGGAAPT